MSRSLEETDVALIQSVKLTPSLYDTQHSHFRLPYRKKQDWESVAAIVGLTSVEARRRWTCLRDRYSRELKQVRLYPEKGEFGKNELFRLMDFLRCFVRKRSERRRNGYKYENTWEATIDTKTISKISPSEDEDVSGIHTYEETQHNYQSKLEVSSTDVTEYHNYVEDTNETFNEYVEQSAETSNSTGNTKALNDDLLPIVLTPSESSPYTINSDPMPSSLQNERIHNQSSQINSSQDLTHQQILSTELSIDNEDDFFCKSVAAYLRHFTRRYKIKAKVEIFQILEKYIEIEENNRMNKISKKD